LHAVAGSGIVWAKVKNYPGLPDLYALSLFSPEFAMNGIMFNFKPVKKRRMEITSDHKNDSLEETVADGERKFRMLIEHSSDGIVLLSDQGKVLYESPSATRLIGYTPDEREGKSGFDNIHPDDALLARQRLISIAKQPGATTHVEYRAVRKDGSIWWTEAVATNLLEEPGIRGIVVNFRDVTERRLAEERLRASEEKYRGLIESLDSVVAAIDSDGRFLYMNDVATRQFGSKPESLIGKTMHELFPEPVASKQLEGIRKVIREDKGNVTEDFSIIRGEPRWFHNSLQPIHDGDGHVAYVLLHSTDIHDLKTAQQELARLISTLEERVREATSEIQDLYDNAPIGYHSLDADGKIIVVNQTELDWLGYTREELLGKPFISLLTPASVETFYNNFPQYIQRGFVHDLEFEIIRKDGSTFPVLVSATAIKDEKGNFVKSRSTMTDITARKQAEEALKLTNAELQRAAKIKDEFIAHMSHELRTPLNAILGHSELLIRQFSGSLNERQLRYMKTIEKSGRQLLELITGILDLSKLEARQMTLDLATVVISDICEASLIFVREIAGKKNITLTCLLDPEFDLIRADGIRLRQMLINLLSNAVKFTPEGGSVDLQVKVNETNETVSFSVTDTGIGISKNDLQRLFQPFVQLDSGLNRLYDGSGLGLTLVDRMAKLHGGNITVQSEVGKGSRFTINLPWKKQM
jgi:PAS domain S-box-containing protein